MREMSIWLLCLMLAASMTACSASGDTSMEAETEQGTGTETEESGETTEEIVVEDYDVNDYVTLGTYTGFEVDKVITEVSDADVEEQIEYEMEENATEIEVTAGAAEGDYVNIDYEILVDGEAVDSIEIYGVNVEGGSEEDRDLMIGYWELGEAVDDGLLGAEAGDTLSVSATLDGDIFGDDMDGVEAEFNITVNRVYNYEIPELTEEYVAEYTEYDSVDAYMAAVKETLEASTEEYNLQEAGELALSMAVAEADFNGYPETLYESVYSQYEELYTYYAEMFGMEREDLVSDEDLAAAAEEEVCAELVVEAIREAEGLDITDDEYEAYIEEMLSDYGVESEEELYEYYEESALREDALRTKVINFILDTCTFTEMSEEDYEAKYYGEDEDEDVEDIETTEVEELDSETYVEEETPVDADEEAQNEEDATRDEDYVEEETFGYDDEATYEYVDEGVD